MQNNKTFEQELKLILDDMLAYVRKFKKGDFIDLSAFFLAIVQLHRRYAILETKANSRVRIPKYKIQEVEPI